MGKSKLKFYKGSHTYYIGKKKLDSVTTYIGEFFEPFNAREIARKLAKFTANKAAKRGVRYWLNKWKDSREFGTKVHREIEVILESGVPLLNPQPHSKNAVKWFRENYHDFYTVEAEKQLYDEELGLAGTIDLVIIGHFNEKKVILVDWKTNEKLSSSGYNGKTGVLPPTSSVQDCHISKYGLQLSLYAYMMERQGYEIDKLFIVHLSEEGAKQVEVAYLKDKIEEMLIYSGRLTNDSSNNNGG